MRDRKEYYKYQKKIVTRIIKLLDEKVKHKKKEVKMYAYINYLEKNTTLNRIRIKKILDINPHKLLSIGELYEIASALGVELYELFEID